MIRIVLCTTLSTRLDRSGLPRKLVTAEAVVHVQYVVTALNFGVIIVDKLGEFLPREIVVTNPSTLMTKIFKQTDFL